ncbi:hypothetical protein [Pseudorhodoferax sp.]|uniref:hypothetical protein n=1 Tax=Pseudorhodoferax sp. TaxID=1993553 RepID=UPI002DD661CF|nr:hypothetical protein [Pseudorhodoferax sp.]
MVVFANATLTLTLAAQGLLLHDGERGPVFQGDWALGTEADMRVFGHCLPAAGQGPAPASLLIQSTAGGSAAAGERLTATLHAGDGRPLLGPVRLQRVAQAPIRPVEAPATRPAPLQRRDAALAAASGPAR